MERESATEPLGRLAHRSSRWCRTKPAFGDAARLLHDDGKRARWLHPGFSVELFRDEGEGYYLNLTQRRAGVVRDVAHRRRGSRRAPGRRSSAQLQRGRPLARCAGAVDNVPLDAGIARLAAGVRRRALRPEPKKRRAPAVVPRGRTSDDDERGRRLPVALVAAQGGGATGQAVPAEPPARCRSRPRLSCRRRGRTQRRRPPTAPKAVPPPLPTLDDVAKLTRDSDFRRFVAPASIPGCSNAAMKKLFADPHFNVMDGLDTYIDDYNKPDPMPAVDAASDGAGAHARAVRRRGRGPREAGATPSPPRRRAHPLMKTLICNCNRTMPLDAKALAAALTPSPASGATTPSPDGLETTHTLLCRREAAAFQRAAKSGDELLVACTQESRLVRRAERRDRRRAAAEPSGRSASSTSARPAAGRRMQRRRRRRSPR